MLFSFDFYMFRIWLHRQVMASVARMSLGSGKPPNILVLGEDCESWKKVLSGLVNLKQYLVYTTTSEELSSNIWVANCSLLLISTLKPQSHKVHQLKYNLANYLDGGGRIILCHSSTSPQSISSLIDVEVKDETVSVSNQTGYRLLKSNVAVFESGASSAKREVLKKCLEELNISCETEPPEEPKKTVGYLITNMSQAELSKKFRPKAANEVYILSDSTRVQLNATPVIRGAPDPPKFNTKEYFAHLQTKHLGKTLLYTENVSTTMVSIKTIELIHGAVAVATRQLNAVARGRNSWISPKGCAMFSLSLKITRESPLGGRLPLLQHMIALSIVKAIRGVYPQLEVAIKWPNDVYFKRNVKLGGILCTSTLHEGEFLCHAGCGVNISNSKPTVSVNDLAQSSVLSVERFIAGTLTELEKVLEMHELRPDEVLREYHRYWLHSEETVRVKVDDRCEDIVIKGIDEFGFLVAKRRNGLELKLQPDGNSFDLIQGLITTK